MPESLVKIGERAFNGCKLETLIIPQNVTTIEDYAFYDCKSLDQVSLGQSVKSIGSSAFANNISLKEFHFNNEIKSIGSGIFKSCTSLTEINIPPTISTIPNGAFQGCSNLVQIELDQNITNLGEWAFYGCIGLNSISIQGNINEIPDNCFGNCKNLKSFVLPESVTAIGDYSFEQCTELNLFTFNQNLSSIGKYAFRSCSSLDFEEISPNLTTLGVGAFQDCTSLSRINLPIGIKSLTSWVFSGCTAMKEVQLSQLITYIGDKTFENCSKLDAVYVKAQTPPTLNSSAFSNSYPEYIKLHVPVGAENLYKNAEIWKNFGSIVGDLDVDIVISGLSLSYHSKIIYPEETFQIKPYITPSNASNKNLTWSSSNDDIATVDESGVVKGIAPGYAYISAETTDGSKLTSSCLVTVSIAITEIILNENSLVIPVGNRHTLTATFYPYNADNRNLLWESSAPSIVSVNQDGSIYAIKEGEATISVKCSEGPEVSAECKVSVVIPVSNIILSTNSLSLSIGEQESISVTINPNNASNHSISWESLNSSIASVENGVITANDMGSTTIIARSNDGFGATAMCEVNVGSETGIAYVLLENNDPVKIFNTNGILIYQGLAGDADLPAGIYIVQQNGKMKKINVK